MNNPAQLTAYDTSGKARPAQSSMTTEATPEQKAKWHGEARKIVHNEPRFTESENVCDWYVGGYLRAKQENEQAIKDARKQALEEAIAICNVAIDFYGAKSYIADKLKELLK